jgi:hypothetical protein
MVYPPEKQMKKLLHLLLLFTFVLLQSVAPLVHAHVDGDQGQGLAQAQEAKGHSALVNHSQYFIEQSESPAICIADQLQRNHDVKIFLAVSVYLKLHSSDLVLVTAHSPVENVNAAVAPYQNPLPHAPPILG